MANNRCPGCGALYAMVGRTHRCIPKAAAAPVMATKANRLGATGKPGRAAAASSRGSRESRPTLQPTERPPSVDRTKPKRARSLGKPEVAPGPREKSKRGRPKLGEKRDRPWERVGVSRATWYQRQKDGK